jgi:hypothetical protein
MKVSHTTYTEGKHIWSLVLTKLYTEMLLQEFFL